MTAEPERDLVPQPTSKAPLSGITVLGLEQAIAAPLCTRHLADPGARVIKIKQPGSGDMARHYDDVVRGMAAHFIWLNHGKESAALDLTEPSDLDVFTALLERADVLVSNLAPGALRRLGRAWASRKATEPGTACVAGGHGPAGSAWSSR
jgi:itaconate CoA-transferase